MCGIIGILSKNPDIISNQETIKKMTSSLEHRGPDAWGIFNSQNMYLGHTRLSIIDIQGGNQPMITDRYVISFNGEIFNYIELRDELKAKGCTFQTASDTEVIIKLIDTYGPSGIPKLNGQFAFLLWDRVNKKLLICRDRYGMQPLYHLSFQGSHYFASEMKAFDQIPGFKRSFNMEQLLIHGYFWNTLADKTVYQNIRSIRSGTYEIFSLDGTSSINRYYELGESQGKSPNSLTKAIDEFSSLLEDSVKLRLRSDVPVANYLSGGIDSSVITYLTSLYNMKQFKTFSIGFEDKDFDESIYQLEMVKKVNSNHYQEVVTYNSLNENLLKAVYHFERPVFRTAPIPLFLLSNAVKNNGYKVVLSGEAADEILWGYDAFKELKLMQFWKRRPQSEIRPLLIKKLYPHLRHFADPRRFGLMKMYYEGFLNSFENDLVGLNVRLSNNQIVSNYINKEYSFSIESENLLQQVQNVLPENFGTWSILQKNQFLEMKTLLSGYLLSSQGDRMSMSHGVEARYPFLDHRLVEKLFYFKDEFKLNGFSQKYLLRKAFESVLPSSILNRPKMPYQAPDLRSFMKQGSLTELASDFLSERKVKEAGIFDPKMVNRFLAKVSRSPLDQIGYRDNMLITFILTTHICNYWIQNPTTNTLKPELQKVNYSENKE